MLIFKIFCSLDHYPFLLTPVTPLFYFLNFRFPFVVRLLGSLVCLVLHFVVHFLGMILDQMSDFCVISFNILSPFLPKKQNNLLRPPLDPGSIKIDCCIETFVYCVWIMK
jgi:hypothetical protein